VKALKYTALGVTAFGTGAVLGVVGVCAWAALHFRAIPFDGPPSTYPRPWDVKARWN
jgi:hypothetical protein